VRASPERHVRIPSIGDRIEVVRAGVVLRAQVFYADQLQVLVKFENGRSASLVVGKDTFHVIER
jgi:hypothetical protein